jgi:hypothetical protein
MHNELKEPSKPCKNEGALMYYFALRTNSYASTVITQGLPD